MLSALFFVIVSLGFSEEPPSHTVSPTIENGVMIIQGKIDSHIYDYLNFPNDKMGTVHTVRLNSWGGNHNWGIEIAKRIQEKQWNTEVIEGEYCASACVYLFGAGIKRIAHSSNWFGIHGARMGAGYMITFAQKCIADEKLVENTECQELEEQNYQLNLKSTREAFALIEDSGVLPSLWETYMGFEDTEDWYLNFNFLKKPDWVLPATEALPFALVTDLKGAETEQ